MTLFSEITENCQEESKSVVFFIGACLYAVKGAWKRYRKSAAAGRGASISRDGEILFRQEYGGDFSYRKLFMLRLKTPFRKAFFGETRFQGFCGEGEDGCIGYLRVQRGVLNGDITYQGKHLCVSIPLFRRFVLCVRDLREWARVGAFFSGHRERCRASRGGDSAPRGPSSSAGSRCARMKAGRLLFGRGVDSAQEFRQGT